MTTTTEGRPPITLAKIRMAFVQETSGRSGDTIPRVLAVMIDVPWSPDTSKEDVCCYALMGQHGSCSIKYARALADCANIERAYLLKHLTRIYGDQLIEVVPIATITTWEPQE